MYITHITASKLERYKTVTAAVYHLHFGVIFRLAVSRIHNNLLSYQLLAYIYFQDLIKLHAR
jgi:hypothetical protein